MSLVLVTGSAGAVGLPVCQALRERGHQVRAFDRVPTPHVSEMVVADLEDRAAVRDASHGVDAIVHLAAEPHDRDFPELVGPNVFGLFHVLDAARQETVKRVVLASSIQVLSKRDRVGAARTDEAHPGNHYGLTKLWAEEMGAMYARRFGLSVIAARIAWLVRDAAEARRLLETRRQALYLSHRDAGRFFAHAVEATAVDFAVLYAVGPEGSAVFDMEPARRVIGFEAHDVWPAGLGFELPGRDA